MPNTKRPAAVVVSICAPSPASTRRPTPRADRSCTVLTQMGEVAAEAVRASRRQDVALAQGAQAAVETCSATPCGRPASTRSTSTTSGWRGRAATATSERRLLSAPAVADADRRLPVAASPHDWLAERRFALDDGLRRLAAEARAGAIAGESIEESVLRVERTETAVPDGAADLVADL